jgi:hypothetical protein
MVLHHDISHIIVIEMHKIASPLNVHINLGMIILFYFTLAHYAYFYVQNTFHRITRVPSLPKKKIII